jgi:hypothetical protein
MGLIDSPLCWRCGAQGDISAHVWCECEVLTTLRHAILGSFLLDPEHLKADSHAAMPFPCHAVPLMD